VILEHMNDAYAVPGASAAFECRVVGEPLPHITWYMSLIYHILQCIHRQPRRRSDLPSEFQISNTLNVLVRHLGYLLPMTFATSSKNTILKKIFLLRIKLNSGELE